ncbi:hypothetical protein [Alkalihalophilus marmarensis]|uniref:Uncharacterized protein n=1 Tax=Alkalihalophilus marmarensis DSM 21297 TaxID=1188261 RepID=U6SMC2_9BACI|nr:hypothetical protein [Alkalihalophilus marmarensis]ERN52065.1 hypothetical protein A33I_18405 [Alkalihalophilus marmarensis DSM 21297]
MKLIGSKTEQEIREQLIKSNQLLFNSEEKKRLLEVIRYEYPELKAAYIIHWIPEQGEDIYKILINDSLIAEIELERHNYEVKPKAKTLTVPQYLKGLSKQNQIKLAVALDLVKQELKDVN